MTSNQVVYSNTEIDYLPYPTTIVPQVPTDVYTPLDLSFAISSLTTSYQYSNVTLIDNYNVTVSSTTAFYYVDSNNCYGGAFSNQIISDYGYADNLVLVAGWSNQTGFFDVYNGGNIPITFQPEFALGLSTIVIPSYTNLRATFLPGNEPPIDNDPPIHISPITSDGLTPIYLSSLYINSTYVTQSSGGTLLEIDIAGTDINGNPITGIGTLNINANVDLYGNNIVNVNSLSAQTVITDYLQSSNNHGIIVNGDLSFQGYNINSVNQLAVDYILPNVGDYVTFPNNGISTDLISPYTNPYIGFNADIELSGYNVIGCTSISTDYITSNMNNGIDFQGTNLSNINYISTDSIGPNVNTGINFQGTNLCNINYISTDSIAPYANNGINFQGTNLSNINYLYMDGFFCSIPNTSNFEEVRFISYPDIGAGVPPFYFAYSPDSINFTPIAADWSAFKAYTYVDLNQNNISNVNIIGVDYIEANNNDVVTVLNPISVDYIKPNINGTVTINGTGIHIIGEANSNTVLIINGAIDVDYINPNSNSTVTISGEGLNVDYINPNSNSTVTINGAPYPNMQWGISIGLGIVTLSPSYSDSNTYSIQLTYTAPPGALIAPNVPLYSFNVTSNGFSISGDSFYNVCWTTIGL